MRFRKFRYSWRQLGGDASGGLIAALIALPYGLAMASLMGLPPVLGVFTSLLTSPFTALFGRNPVLIGGTSSVTVPFITEAVRQQGIGGAAKVSLVAAGFMMVFSLLRLGRYVALVPHPVVTGFSCGIGAMMVVSQMKTIAGLKLPFGASPLDQFWLVIVNLDRARLAPLLLAGVVIAVCALMSRRSPKLPAPLIGVALALGLATVFHVSEPQVGDLSLRLPPLAAFAWTARDVYTVLPAGLALAFVSSVNILITSRVVEHFRGWRRSMKKADADAELGAYGIANVVAGFFAAPPSVGIPARSLANVRCGGATRISNLFHALILAGLLGLGSTVLARIPMAALAGVTAWMGFCLLEWSTWARLPRMRRVDAAAFLFTAILTLAVNAVASVAVGCGVYLVDAAWRRLHANHTSDALSADASL